MRTNTELQIDIINELNSDPELSSCSTEIGVSVKEGAVTLSGLVNSYAKKLAAERAAKRVKGVKVVALEIEVVLPGKNSHTDTGLARAVNQALRWHMAVEDERIQARVEDGWVFLEGEVEWSYQKMLAEEALENVPEVEGVVNLIIVNHGILDTVQEKNSFGTDFFNVYSAIDCETKFEVTTKIEVVKPQEEMPSANKKVEEKEGAKASGFAFVENRYIKNRNKSRFGYPGLSPALARRRPKRF